MVGTNILALVKRVVEDRLQSSNVVDVLVERDEDFDGDEILRVTVVVDAPASAFDPKRIAGLVRHLRSALAEEADEHDFPMVSYINQRELGMVTT